VLTGSWGGAVVAAATGDVSSHRHKPPTATQEFA